MLKADENVIDELASMSSSSNQHYNGGRGALAVKVAVYVQERPLLTQNSCVPTSFVRDCSVSSVCKIINERNMRSWLSFW